MPSKSPAQKRLMAAAAHNPELAEQIGMKPSVAQEFHQADVQKSLAMALRRKKLGGE